METELSDVNRKPAEKIKEINRLKHQINKDTDINGTPNVIDVSIDEDINIRRNNGNDERFIDDFIAFKKFVTLEFQKFQLIVSRNKFQPIYTKPIDLKEDDVHTINLQINNLVTQNRRRLSPIVNKYPDRDLLHHHIKNATTSIVPGDTDFNNAVKFGRKLQIV